MKKTSLYSAHFELHANLSEFSGYSMPLWYQSAKNEHLSVIKNIGIFDTSHMAFVICKGNNALVLLNKAFSRNLESLKDNRLIYGLFLDSKNHVIDDVIIYKYSNIHYMIVVNSGMSNRIIEHLNSFLIKDYILEDLSGKLCKIDIQGPKTLLLMEKIYGSSLFETFPYFSFKKLKDGVLISRSGYTGEFGFELYIESEKALLLWYKLLKEGEEFDITPCGLASRDSLRVGACLPLSHKDIGDWVFCNNPWSFALDKPIKSDSSFTYPYVGFDVRKLHNSEGSVMFNNKIVGSVLSCVTEVSITRFNDKVISIASVHPNDLKFKGLVAGFLKVNRTFEVGTILLLSDGKRKLKVEIVDKIRPDRTVKKSLKYIRSLYE